MFKGIGRRSLVLLIVFSLALFALYVFHLWRPEKHLEQWWDMQKHIIKNKPPATEPYELPKIIWSYWHDDNIPVFVNQVLKHRASVLAGWEINVLNDKTIKNYISELPPNFDDLYQSHKSDWLRFALLEKYGGCWLDATIIVNSLSKFNKTYNESVDRKSELTGFYTPMALENNDPTTFIESWFLMAPRGSRVIKEIYKEFTTAVTIGLPEYRLKVLKEFKINNNIFKSEGEDVYLSVYAAIQVALNLRLKRKMNMILHNSFHTMYKLHYDCWNDEKKDYDSVCIVDKLRTNKNYVKKIPYIKFTKAQYSLLKDDDVSSYFH